MILYYAWLSVLLLSFSRSFFTMDSSSSSSFLIQSIAAQLKELDITLPKSERPWKNIINGIETDLLHHTPDSTFFTEEEPRAVSKLFKNVLKMYTN